MSLSSSSSPLAALLASAALLLLLCVGGANAQGELIAHFALDAALDLAAETIHEGVSGEVGQCATMLMPDLDSTKVLHVQQELLNWCPTTELQWDPDSGANKEKTWNVHSTLGGGILGVGTCLFEVDWRPKVGGTLFNCNVAAIREHLGDSMNDAQKTAKIQELQRKFPKAHFTYHIQGVNLDVFGCKLEHHQGFVHTFVSLPKVAAPWPNGGSGYHPSAAEINAFEQNPYIFFNIELWTYGDCSGYKAPGVSWVFTYKVDYPTGKITTDWGKDSDNRPVAKSESYVAQVSAATGQDAPILVRGYTENTQSVCGLMNVCHMG